MIEAEAPPQPMNRCSITTPCSPSVYILLTVLPSSLLLGISRKDRCSASLPPHFSVNDTIGKSTFFTFFPFLSPPLFFSLAKNGLFRASVICMGRNCRSYGSKNCANLQILPAVHKQTGLVMEASYRSAKEESFRSLCCQMGFGEGEPQLCQPKHLDFTPHCS